MPRVHTFDATPPRCSIGWPCLRHAGTCRPAAEGAPYRDMGHSPRGRARCGRQAPRCGHGRVDEGPAPGGRSGRLAPPLDPRPLVRLAAARLPAPRRRCRRLARPRHMWSALAMGAAVRFLVGDPRCSLGVDCHQPSVVAAGRPCRGGRGPGCRLGGICARGRGEQRRGPRRVAGGGLPAAVLSSQWW